MRRFRSRGLGWVAAVISLGMVGGCGGHPPAGQSPFVARVVLSPGGVNSLQAGNFIGFIASATNASGTNVSATITYTSSDTSILNIAPNGVACAGRWDANFTTCTPGGVGEVVVTASAQNANSPPTYVFVHPPIDNIIVKGVLLDGLPVQEPCLTQGQSMTVEAHAFSQGADITQSVGPFTWSANNTSVVSLVPIVSNQTYNFPTYQATAEAITPGITYIYASASGVSSSAFQQPPPGVNLTYFETCPVQNIVLQLGPAGSGQSGQTTFSVSKGVPQNATATVTDVFGNQLSKVPLTWTASHPGSVSVSTGCLQSCSISTPLPGSGAVTASCSPPTCNIGFPQIPAGLVAPFIPVPVYASPLQTNSTPPPTGNGAISGVVSGAASPSVVLASTLDCALENPNVCSAGIYGFSTARASTGSATGMPNTPNSLLPSPAGDKFYIGSYFGAMLMNPSNLGTQNGAFTPLGTVTGKVLAVSPNGNFAIFSDTLHTPNQVYIVNNSNASSPIVTALNISESNTAAFSPDSLKAYIFGLDSNNLPNLYLYSSLQALQIIPLPPQTSVNSIAFSTNGAFAYVVEPSLAGGNPAITVLNTCDDQVYTDTKTGLHNIPLAANPVAFKVLPDGIHLVALESNGTLEFITSNVTPIPIAKLTEPPTPAPALCPMTVGHTKQAPINLGQGSIDPINFFFSADGTLVYVVASNRNSILVLNFNTGGVSGIQMLGSSNPTPVAADMTVDAGAIMVAGSDGLVHQIATASGGTDQAQFGFPNLANYMNPFCTFTPGSGPCTFNYVAAKP
jgi:hypothetical protein